MIAPTVLVTSAAGKTGRLTTLALLQGGVAVRAMVRREDARAAELRRRGADVVVGNLNDVADVRAALAGVQRAYWAAPMRPGALEAATLFASVAEDEHLQVVVSLSQWLADPGHPSVHTRAEWLSDRVFSWMPSVGSITVNPGYFAENYTYTLDAVAQFGILTMPMGEGRNAPPSNEDIAAVAAALLINPGPHLGRSYRPTGPELVGPGDVARIFSRVLGRTVRYRDVPFSLLAKSATLIGFDAYAVAQLQWYTDELKRGTFAIGAPTDAVETLTGRAPETLETITRRYLARMPGTRRGATGMARAALLLTRAAATAAPDHRRYLLDHQDGVAHGQLSIDSADWRATHDPDHTAGPTATTVTAADQRKQTTDSAARLTPTAAGNCRLDVQVPGGKPSHHQ